MKFVGEFQREIRGEFPAKEGKPAKSFVDFQFMDFATDPKDALEELIRFRVFESEHGAVEEVRKGLKPRCLYEVVVNRLSWDRSPVVYGGRIGLEVKR